MNYDSTRRDASHPASGRRAIFNGSAGDVHYYWAVDGAPYESRFAHPGAWKRGRKTRRSFGPCLAAVRLQWPNWEGHGACRAFVARTRFAHMPSFLARLPTPRCLLAPLPLPALAS